MKLKFTFLFIVLFTLVMSEDSVFARNRYANSSISDIPVTGVKVSHSKLALVIGSFVQLNATVTPLDATITDVTWSSSKPTVVAVDKSGMITCLSEGNATITVTTVEGSKTATSEVTVGNLDLFEEVNVGNATDGMTKTGGWDNARVGDMNNDEYMIAQNSGSVQFTFDGTEVAVIGFLAGGNYGASYVVTVDGIEIASGNTSSVDDKFNAVLGFKTGLRAGTHTVKITRTGGAEFSQFVIIDAIKVSNKPVDVIVDVTGVKLPSNQSLVVGSTVKLPVIVEPLDASNINVTWYSSNLSVATVTETGLMTCLSTGSANITATTVDGGKTATSAVIVGSLEGFTPVNIGNANDGMTKSGGWDNAREGDMNGDEYMIAQNIGFIEYNFIGTHVAVIGFLAGPNYAANYTIYVDDDSIASGSTFSMEEKFNAVLGFKGGLSSGLHIVKIARTDGVEWSQFVIVDGLMIKDAPTGISIKESSAQLLVYPNPVINGFLNISLNKQAQNELVTIYNIAGQTVFSGFIRTGENLTINCNSFKRGTYLLKVTGNDINEVRKIQVLH